MLIYVINFASCAVIYFSVEEAIPDVVLVEVRGGTGSAPAPERRSMIVSVHHVIERGDL